jgi:hypothetical protein
MVWARRVAHIPENEMLNNFWKIDYKEREHMENLGILGKILIWICKERDW